MVDTLNLRLTQADVAGVDFLAEIPCYLDDVSEHNYSNGTTLVGRLGVLKVSVNQRSVRVGGASLCKWQLGDNYKEMGRQDVQRAIERLSDELHLPMAIATATRIDVAHNFIMQHPTEVYLSHLGLLKHYQRLQQPASVYYSGNGGLLCFYDKNKEQQAHKEHPPELYKGKNVLRYEQRYLHRLPTLLKEPEITAAMLYKEAFYIKLFDNWVSAYRAINKINDITLNWKSMKTKKELSTMGVLSLVDRIGGQTQMLDQISDAAKRGEISRKQAYDLRTAVNDACKLRDGFTAKSDAISELDKKVSEAARFYR